MKSLYQTRFFRVCSYAFALLFLLLITMTWAASAENLQQSIKKTTVSGQVVNDKNEPLVSQLVFFLGDTYTRINTDLFGRFKVSLPLGAYVLEVSKGSLYERKEITLSLPDRNPVYMDDILLEKLYETDWLAGDLHQHTIYSFDGTDSPFDVYVSDLSSGLNYGVVTDHNDIRACSEYVYGNAEGFIALPGLEITTNRGHFNAILFKTLVDHQTSQGAADVQRIIHEVRKDPSALLQINHPERENSDFSFLDWELADQFDLLEVWNGKALPPYVPDEPNNLSMEKWFSLLRQGLFLPATGGSDNHDIFGNKMFYQANYQSEDERYYYQSMFSGTPKTYVLPAENTAAGILQALKQGNSFVTNNPLAYLSVNGAIPGQTISAGLVTAHIDIRSNRPLVRFRLLINGKEAVSEEIYGLTFAADREIMLNAGDFLNLEVLGDHGDYAFSNPIFAAK